MSESNKVLIIGAGLGGLTLAHSLHKNNIPFELFERDPAPTSRKQGWAITLVESIPILTSLLPPSISSSLPSVGVNFSPSSPSSSPHDSFAFVDLRTGQRVALTGNLPLGQPGSFLRANREALRSFLWTSNALPITPGKHFTHYTTSPSSDGTITAHFKDGTSSQGSLLVGAEGLHSRVRTQLLSAAGSSPAEKREPELSEYIPLFGEVDLPKERYGPYLDMGNAGLLASGPGLRFLIGPLGVEPDGGSARFFWALMVRRGNDPEKLSDWIQGASQREKYEYAIGTCEDGGVHESLKGIIEFGGPEAILEYQPKFLEFITPEDLPEGERVVLLGDAAHGMLPFRGAGANSAIEDAADLGKLLKGVRKRGGDFGEQDMVREYLGKMVPRGREAVLSSRRGGSTEMDDPGKYFGNFLRK